MRVLVVITGFDSDCYLNSSLSFVEQGDFTSGWYCWLQFIGQPDSYILVFLYKTGVESSIGLFFIILLLFLLYTNSKKNGAPNPGIDRLLGFGEWWLLPYF